METQKRPLMLAALNGLSVSRIPLPEDRQNDTVMVPVDERVRLFSLQLCLSALNTKGNVCEFNLLTLNVHLVCVPVVGQLGPTASTSHMRRKVKIKKHLPVKRKHFPALGLKHMSVLARLHQILVFLGT